MNKIRKIFIEDLVLNSNSTVNWKNSVGRKVRFVYDEISGYINILDYYNTNYHIKIQYNEKIMVMFVGSFKNCLLQELLNIKTIQHRYDVGEIINNKEILDKIRVKKGSVTEKGYNCKCLNCNNIIELRELYVLHNKDGKCPNCTDNSKITTIGKNDMWTTNPNLAILLENPEDGYKYMTSSNKKVNWRCPNCDNIINNKSINSINIQGLSCNLCNDNISIPEKFMANILRCLQINYCKEKIFDWSNLKRYDYYFGLKNKKIIIEVHGGQHYQSSFERIGGKTLKEEQYNDKIKEDLAKQNNIDEYIIINAQSSKLEWLKESVLKSKISIWFDLSNLNWEKIYYNSLKSKMIEACLMWKNGIYDIDKISKKLDVKEWTIREYLKRGNKLNLCNYNLKFLASLRDKSSFNAKKIKCITTNVIFPSLHEAARTYNIKSPINIRNHCLGNQKYAGKLSDGTKLIWEYV